VLRCIGERVTDDEVDEMVLMADLDGARSLPLSPSRRAQLVLQATAR